MTLDEQIAELKQRLALVRDEANHMLETELGDGYVAAAGQMILRIVDGPPPVVVTPTPEQKREVLAAVKQSQQTLFGYPIVVKEDVQIPADAIRFVR